MAKIDNPKIKNMNFPENQLRELPLRADETTAKKYLEDNGLGTYSSFESSNPNFSNKYGNAYNYYLSGETTTEYWGNTGITYEWRTEFGYYPVITSITYI